MSDALKTSVNFKGDLRRRLEWYCDVNDLQPAQAVKMFVIHALKKYAKCPRADTPSRTREDNKDLSLDKSNSSKDEQVEFVKSFIGNCQNLKFPERISKEIKNHWDSILDSKLSATELFVFKNTRLHPIASKLMDRRAWLVKQNGGNKS
jgi:hypothetical protein